MESILYIKTLGNLSITRFGKPALADTSRRKAEALFVYLACEQYDHPRTMLATMFWEDSSQSQAMANLRVVLHALKQELAPYLVITRQTVAFDNQTNYWFDFEEVTSKLTQLLNKQARISLQTVDCEMLKETLTLYKGDFLAGFQLHESSNFENWQRLQQEKIHRLVVDGYYMLARAQAQQGHASTAVETIHTLLEFEPLSEQGHYLLLQLLSETNQFVAARRQAEHYRQLLAEQLQTTPGDDIAALIAHITTGERIEIQAEKTVPHNLPRPLTAFMPRPAEMNAISERLQNDDCRLITLVGSGGTGKTRLAIEAARQHRRSFPDGVYFVSFAPLRQSDFIPAVIANALNLRLESTKPVLEQVIEQLEHRNLLLVLDNCEHLVDAPAIIHQLLLKLPRLTVLATSRSPLNLLGEWLVPVGGMALSPRPDQTEASALQFFSQCAQRVQPDFQLSTRRAAVYEICQLVEGLPLAIELAAAALWHTDITTLLAQLHETIQVLATDAHNVPERQRSIEAIFAYSLNLLDGALRKKVTRLAVFRSDFSTGAAQAIGDITPAELSSLARQSLVQEVDTDYYRLHALLRRYLLNQLEQSGTIDKFYQQHYDYYFHQVTAILESDTNEIDQLARFERIDDEVRAALERAHSSERTAQMLSLALKLTFFWERRAYYGEGRYWLEQGLAAGEISDALRADVLYYTAMLAWGQSDYDAQSQYAAESLRLTRQLDDPVLLMRSLILNGNTAIHLQNYPAARQYLEEGLAIAEAEHDARRQRILKANLGTVCLEDHDYAASIHYFEQVLPDFRQPGNEHHLATALANIGFAYHHTGKSKKAMQSLQEALQIGRQLDSIWVQALALSYLGEVADAKDNLAQARQHHLQSLTLYHQAGNRAGVASQLTFVGALDIARGQVQRGTVALAASKKLFDDLHDRKPDVPDKLTQTLARVKATLPETRFKAYMAKGRSLSIDDIIAFLQ